MTWRLYYCSSEISTVQLFNQNLFISIRSCLLSFKRSRLDPLKLTDLLVLSLDCVKFYIMLNMNFTKDFCVKLYSDTKVRALLLLFIFFIVGLSYRMTVLTVMVCAWRSVIPIITLLILITYIGHFFLHLNSDCWHWKWCMCFSRVSVNFFIAVLTVSAYFNHIW